MATRREATVRLTAGQALVLYLQAQFSERDGKTRRLIPAVFGIFGHGNVCGIGQALEEYGEELPYVQPCNEQSMVHTASAFAKSTLRLQTLACLSSIGPGATNMVTGAALATINHLPVLLLAGDYYATRHQGPVLQQLEHPVSADVSVNDCFRPVSRFFDRITRPEQLLTALPEAMRVLTDPVSTGAAVLALPQDVQSHAYDFPARFFRKKVWRVDRPLPDPWRIQQVVKVLKKARRPLLIAGGGVIYADACGELAALSAELGIPVSETFAGKGALRDASPLSLGGPGLEGTGAAYEISRGADLVMAVGTRLTDFATGSQSAFQNPRVGFIGVNVAGHDAYKNGAFPVIGDARETLAALRKEARRAGIRPNPAYALVVRRAREKWARVVDREAFSPIRGEAMSQSMLIRIMNQAARPGDTVIAAAGGPPGDLLKLWDATGGRSCHLEFGYSCMGYEIPAGLGVRMAQPRGEVVVFVGDGTYLMNPTELVTAMRERLKITVVISENHGYQVIRRLQMWRTGKSFGTEFRLRDRGTHRPDGDYVSIDFAGNAASMGARTWRVKTPEELAAALSGARKETRCCVIVAETEKHRMAPSGGFWWDVAPAEETGDAVTRKIRRAYEQDKARLQRFYY
jgi:3D-(3,5/4)-trihydroxycyclohexane-1,2-dione acylhydrolase (decyclizing)